MKYQWTIMSIGIFVVAFPLLHLPASWEIILHVFLGLLLLLTAIDIQQSRTRMLQNVKKTSVKKNPVYIQSEPDKSAQD